MTFLNPLDALIPKVPFPPPKFRVQVTPGARGVDGRSTRRPPSTVRWQGHRRVLPNRRQTLVKCGGRAAWVTCQAPPVED